MEVKEIVLTDTDKKILASYAHFCDGLSSFLGNQYEIVLHNLEYFDHSVVKIINGFYTGRKEGAPITDRALEMMLEIQSTGEDVENIVYFSRNKQGEPMKSTTILIRGENNRIIGLLCINLYLNTSMLDFIQSLAGGLLENGTNGKNEIFAEDIQDLISEAIKSIRIGVNNDSSIQLNTKNKVIISKLYEKGIFNLKDSVGIAAQLLGLSKNTVYLHLRSLTM